MAGLMILVSVFAAGAFARRVATKPEIGQRLLQKEAVANGPGILPVQLSLALRPAAIPRVSGPVVMSMGEVANPVKYPAKLRKIFKGSSIWMSGDDDQVGWQGPDWVPRDRLPVEATVPDLTPEEIAASEDRLESDGEYLAKLRKQFPGLETSTMMWMNGDNDQVEAAADRWEREAKYRVNVRQAYDSLHSAIPQILQLERKGETPMDWGFYTDDLEAEFPNLIDSTRFGAFSAVVAKHVPSWTASIKGKDLHKATFQELREFANKYVEKPEVTTRDWSPASYLGYGIDPELSTHEGDQVITCNWKMELPMKTGEMVWEDSTFPKAIITIQGLSRFHLNDEGKIYRHSMDGFGIGFNKDITPEAADLLLENLAIARRAW